MLLCKFCNKECKNENSQRNHQRLCKSNANRQSTWLETHRDQLPSWNKGHTKETDPRIAVNAANTSIGMKLAIGEGRHSGAWNSEYWTEEVRKNKSEEKKELYRKFPEKHPNRKLAGNRNKMTYPEQVAHDWLLDNKILFEPQKLIDGKYIDFCVDNIVIEIDGEHWHPIGNTADADRDSKLKSLGYDVYRIRSKENIHSRLETIFNRSFSIKALQYIGNV